MSDTSTATESPHTTEPSISSDTRRAIPPTKRILVESLAATLAGCAILSLFIGSGAMAFDNDPLYADVARTMAQTGDWLNPQIHGVPFLDKPPMFFWILGALISLFGDSVWVLRLPAMLFGGLSVGAIVYGARRSGLGLPAALLGAAGILAVPIFHEYSRRAYMEVPVAFCVFGCILAFQKGLTGLNDREGADPRWFLVAGVLAGVGFMLKSLVGLFGVIPFGVLVLVERRWDVLKSGYLWGGVGIALLVAIPWHAYELIANREMFLEFTWKLHVEDQIFDAQPWSTGPWYFYLVKLFVEDPMVGYGALDTVTTDLGVQKAIIIREPGQPMLGGLVLFGLGGIAARYATKKSVTSFDRHLALAILVALLIFSSSETKKMLYMIPIIPTSAMLAARMLGDLRPPIQWGMVAALALVSLITVGKYYDTTPGGFLYGASNQLAPSAVVAKATKPGEEVRMIDDYFSGIQYYANRRTISHWTNKQGRLLVFQTKRIPYIRYGYNMVYTPPNEVLKLMRVDHPGVWVVRRTVWEQIKGGFGPNGAQVLYDEGPVPEDPKPADLKKRSGLVVVKVAPTT